MTENKFEGPKALKALPGRIQQLRLELQEIDPHLLAQRTSAQIHPAVSDEGKNQGEFHLKFWGREIALSYPAFLTRDLESGQELSIDAQAIILFHFRTSRGTSLAGRWIAFSELPDGRFYASAFQGYTGAALVQAFKGEKTTFEQASQSLDGDQFEIGDAAYIFQPLPRIPLLAVYWEGDEDLSSSIQILFDASVVHHLPTDVCAILGSMLTRRLIKAKQGK